MVFVKQRLEEKKVKRYRYISVVVCTHKSLVRFYDNNKHLRKQKEKRKESGEVRGKR